jgi:glycolate oxidase FAD binding subunit
MPAVWKAATAAQTQDAVRQALAAGSSLELMGQGSRRNFGRPMNTQAALDLSALDNIIAYQPDELVVTLQPGLGLAALKTMLAENNQMLAFEPPDYGPLWGHPEGRGTIGGAVLTGGGGPRRLSAGAARDHCLGVKGVNGLGETFAAGGRVVKNVTGFDLPKLIAGSFGTLCAVTELTLKVMPAPPDSLTLAALGLDDQAAVALMARALASPAAVTAAAHLPGSVASASGIAAIAASGGATLFRLEGFTPGVRARAAHLAKVLGGAAALELDHADSLALWKEVGNAAFFASRRERLVWRLSVPPSHGPHFAQLATACGGRHYYDWGGGCVWLELPPADDGHAPSVRQTLKQVVGDDGHAVLLRAPAGIRAAYPPFQPLPPALAALNVQVTRQFDPRGVFNPGRLYPDT